MKMHSCDRNLLLHPTNAPLHLQASEVPNLLEQLQDCNVQLDIVEKGLNDLLDTKKMAFPRSASFFIPLTCLDVPRK